MSAGGPDEAASTIAPSEVHSQDEVQTATGADETGSTTGSLDVHSQDEVLPTSSADETGSTTASSDVHSEDELRPAGGDDETGSTTASSDGNEDADLDLTIACAKQFLETWFDGRQVQEKEYKAHTPQQQAERTKPRQQKSWGGHKSLAGDKTSGKPKSFSTHYNYKNGFSVQSEPEFVRSHAGVLNTTPLPKGLESSAEPVWISPSPACHQNPVKVSIFDSFAKPEKKDASSYRPMLRLPPGLDIEPLKVYPSYLSV